MASESLYVMTPMEVAWGYVYGRVPFSFPERRVDDPRCALERVIRSALLRAPCGVAFSGGRDSSLVLAIATHVARREGLADPVPITKVFPDAPGSHEADWQELVVRHLGLRNWTRITLHDELDLLGPLATARLAEHGMVWPPTIHADIPALEQLGGGSLIDGEGGDETLGFAAHRVAPVARLIRKPWPVRWARLRRAARAVAPSPARVAYLRRVERTRQPTPWLRPVAEAARIAALGDAEASSPLSFATSVRALASRRAQALGHRNRELLARPYGVEVSSPLLQPDVLQALACAGGRLGPGDRTAVLRSLVPDLLPDAVLARTSKAEFGGAYWAGEARDFIERWDGEGLDAALVEPEVLRGLWKSGERSVLTSALLQQAWLADHFGGSARDTSAS